MLVELGIGKSSGSLKRLKAGVLVGESDEAQKEDFVGVGVGTVIAAPQ